MWYFLSTNLILSKLYKKVTLITFQNSSLITYIKPLYNITFFFEIKIILNAKKGQNLISNAKKKNYKSLSN